MHAPRATRSTRRIVHRNELLLRLDPDRDASPVLDHVRTEQQFTRPISSYLLKECPSRDKDKYV